MRTPKKYTENLDKGIVTEEMLCDVLYSYNKRAKNWRDKKRQYKNSYSINSYAWFNNALENEQKYYGYKTEILNLLKPECIHEEILENDYESIIQYYLYYIVGDHSFHHPIKKEDITNYPNLQIVRIEQLITHGTTADRLLSSQFADKVRLALLNGEAKIILNNNNN
jgi:hypothetical protein